MIQIGLKVRDIVMVGVLSLQSWRLVILRWLLIIVYDVSDLAG